MDERVECRALVLNIHYMNITYKWWITFQLIYSFPVTIYTAHPPTQKYKTQYIALIQEKCENFIYFAHILYEQKCFCVLRLSLIYGQDTYKVLLSLLIKIFCISIYILTHAHISQKTIVMPD